MQTVPTGKAAIIDFLLTIMTMFQPLESCVSGSVVAETAKPRRHHLLGYNKTLLNQFVTKVVVDGYVPPIATANWWFHLDLLSNNLIVPFLALIKLMKSQNFSE